MILNKLSLLSKEKNPQKKFLVTWKLVCWAVFFSSSISFLFLEPIFFKTFAVLLLTIALFIRFSNSQELDSDEPDGGYGKAQGEGCFFATLLWTSVLASLVLFIGTIPYTENTANVVLYAVVVWLCGYFYTNLNSRFDSLYDSSGRSMLGCWVCETGAYSEGSYNCPFCDFVSKDKRRFGLVRHIVNKHQDAIDGIPSFQAVCEECRERDQ